MTSRRLDRLLARVAAVVLRPVMLLLAATWKIRVVAGDETLRKIAASQRPAIYAFWHNRLYPCGYFIVRALRPHGVRLAVLVSLSRDGELAARMAVAERVQPVRGSTSRAGLSGLRELRRAMVRRGLSVVTAPDGPRGPAFKCQAGTIVLAATTAAPIVPMAAAGRAWQVGSWDRLRIPKPFARVAIAIGEPVEVGRTDETASAAAEVERRLNELVTRCESEVLPKTAAPSASDEGIGR